MAVRISSQRRWVTADWVVKWDLAPPTRGRRSKNAVLAAFSILRAWSSDRHESGANPMVAP